MTPRQREILDFIVAFRADHGISPTIAEISRHFGLAPNGVQQHVERMIRKRVLQRIPGAHRSLAPA